MKINRITWTALFFFSLISIAVWFKFNYPQLVISNFSIDRTKVVAIAQDYLKDKRNVDTKSFQTAAVFNLDGGANRYLQRTIGFKGLTQFIRKYDFDLFYWLVRFFKENTKEEYALEISPSTGEIIGFQHTIDENESRREITREEGREKAKEFLLDTFGFKVNEDLIQSNFATHRDNRSDFVFSWYKDSSGIPWSGLPDSGTAKLLIKAVISGDEVLSFSKNSLLIPDQFNRDMDSRGEFSRNAGIIIRILMLALFTSGIFWMIVRQNHLAMYTTKKFYINIMLVSFALSLLGGFNQFESILFAYPTTLTFDTYLGRFTVDLIIGALFITIAILVPSLSGELLHYETSSQNKDGSFLHYIHSTFASRHVTELIVLGYFVCVILLGMQSLLIKFGQTYLGVWVEYKWVGNVATAYLPFLAALTLGYKASFSEEIMYRLYAISLGRKIFNKLLPSWGNKSIFVIVLLSALIWGFSHSGYPVFPTWFRGLEVTCLGLFISFIYLRFGLIPVIVAHYLFDVFWSTAGYIFGTSTPFYFYSSLFVLLIPLALGIIAFCMNKKEETRPMRWKLNTHQLYNLEVLKTFLRQNKNKFENKSQEEIKKEITPHGWDPAIVEVAAEDFLRNPL